MSRNQKPGKIVNTTTSIRLIRVKDLTVDAAYQRDLDIRRAEVIGESLDTSRIGVLVVSLRGDGTTVVIDGQHRHSACLHAGHGDDLIRCEVHEGLSRQDEAALFLKLNGGRKAIGALDDYRAALVSGLAWAVDVDRIATDLNIKITGGNARRTVQAVKAVKSVHLRQRNLSRTLSLLVQWDDRASTFNGEMLKSVSIFFAHYDNRADSPRVDDEHFLRALRNHDPATVLSAIKRRVDGRFIKLPEAGCGVLRELYNRRANRKALPPYVRGGQGGVRIAMVMDEAAE